jgi:hypothetical protein
MPPCSLLLLLLGLFAEAEDVEGAELLGGAAVVEEANIKKGGGEERGKGSSKLRGKLMCGCRHITLTCCYSGKFMSEINFHDGSFQPQKIVITPYLHECITRSRKEVFVLDTLSIHILCTAVNLTLFVRVRTQ